MRDIKNRPLIIVRGGGDLATGTIHRLWRAGFSPIVLEAPMPAAVRRAVSSCEAVFEGECVVEGMKAVLAKDAKEAFEILKRGDVPVIVDPEGKTIDKLKPEVVIDAIIAKKNLGTKIDIAPLTVALGPGFTAGEDVDYVVETQRGHDLGRVIKSGTAVPNTGIPGNIGGYTKERVIYAPMEGRFCPIKKIGDFVKKGEAVAVVENDGKTAEVLAQIDGIIRGLLRDGYMVKKGFKTGDIDPRREELKNCFTISDKARCIAGSVLELVCAHLNGKNI